MSFPKFILIFGLILFGTIGVMGYYKKQGSTNTPEATAQTPATQSIEIILKEPTKATETSREVALPKETKQDPAQYFTADQVWERRNASLPSGNRIELLFNRGEPKLPIVQTIKYSSRVGWQKGRPAWLSDYAGHYHTSRHFIARSLNGKPDYYKQDVSEGDSFNVFREDADIAFHLVVDLSRCQLWFYYHDRGTNERVLLKNYEIGLGRVDSYRASGLLTPLGTYKLGDRIATYKPKSMGYFNGEKVEMIRVFGTRWIPFEEEVEGVTEPAKGLGIHGVPWVADNQGKLVEDVSCVNDYTSDGCIRLATQDIEEIFAIVVTKPTYITIVRDFNDAKLPGEEI